MRAPAVLDVAALLVLASLTAFLAVVGLKNQDRIRAVEARGVAAAVYTDMGTYLERQHALFVRFEAEPSERAQSAFFAELAATQEIGRRHSAHPFHEVAVREAASVAGSYGDYVQTALIAMRGMLTGSPDAGDAAAATHEKYEALRADLSERRIAAEDEATAALVALDDSGSFLKLWAPAVAGTAAIALVAIALRGRRALRRAAALEAERAVAEDRERLLRAAYEAEQHAARSASEAARMKENLVATVSHDFRSPLTSIRGYANILRRKRGALPTKRQDEYLETIERQAERLTYLVDNLLTRSGLEQRRMFGREDRDPVSLAEIAATVAREFSLRGTHRIETVSSSEPLVVVARPAMEQVLTNLMDNACTYSPAGTRVTIQVSVEGDRAVVSVKDEGPGIAAEHLPLIFESFWRPEGQEEKGTGLGLAIVKGLIEEQGGTASVACPPEGGTCFTISLPLHEAGSGAPERPATAGAASAS